jgi:GT2 family glycosyltransferase
MIYFFIPYSTEKDLGKCYNEMMSLLPNDEDYACFTDGDAMFTTHNFGHQIKEITETYPEVPLFTAMTNRVGTKYQCVGGVWETEALKIHWEIGAQFAQEDYLTCADITNKAIESPFSGVLILLRKKEWKDCGGFKEGIGMLGADNSIHQRIVNMGKKVYLMTGVYVLHWYRGGEAKNKQHLL